MKKSECEVAIRRLCHEWAGVRSASELEHPSFSDFKSWLRENRNGHYLEFRSVAGPDYDAEMWFDHEFKQKWQR